MRKPRTSSESKSTDRMGRSRLHNAVIDNDINAVEKELAAGADVNLQDRNGLTPLHFAAQAYSIELARILISAGAEINCQNTYGNTPLASAVFECKGRSGDLIIFLQESGTDQFIKNNYGQSARDTATLIANYDVLQYLTKE